MWKKYNKAGASGGVGQSMPLPTGRRSACDDPAEVSQLEAELCRLQRQLHVMEGDRRAYSEESCNLIRKQQAEINNLRKESEEIGKILRLAKSEKNQMCDAKDAMQLADLTNSLDAYISQCKEEKRRITDLDAELLPQQMSQSKKKYMDLCQQANKYKQILNVEQLINDERKFMGSMKEADIETSIAKRLRVTENRLDQNLVRFNKQLAENARLREELDHLRQDKAVFDAIFKKLSRRLQVTKSEVNSVIHEASQAYEERDEAQNKMLALKERSDKDMAQQEIEMKELQRIIQHDNKLKEFMGIKIHDRADLKEEEQAKKLKGKVSGDKEFDEEKLNIAMLEEAFDKVKEASGQQDIDTIVHDFIKKEDLIFALYNYVNELNDTVENLQDEIGAMKTEIQRFQDDDVKFEEQRIAMIKEMEEKCIKFREEADKADTENVKICKVLDELRAGVSKLFKDAHCDASTISEMLGSEEGVTNKNILQYMGIIEQRTMELLQIQQYIQMKKEPPKQEKKDGKGQPTPPASQQSQRTSPRIQQVAIVTPHLIDDDLFEDGGELRPLTRTELKTVVLKMLHGVSVPDHPSSKVTGKRPKTKSPGPEVKLTIN